MVLKVDSTNVLRDQTTMMQWVTLWPIRSGNKVGRLMANVFACALTIILAACSLGLFVKALAGENLVFQSEAIYMLTMMGTSLHRVLYYRRHHADFQWLFDKSRALAKTCPRGWLFYTGVISQLYCLAGFFSITLWVTGPLVEDVFIKHSVENTVTPLRIYLPGEIPGIYFWIVYAVCCAGAIAAAHIYLSSDSFFFTMIHVANGAVETLGKKLRDMNEEGPDVIHRSLKNCVKDHVAILEYLRKIDFTYRVLIAIDFIHGTISLTFAVLSLGESKSIMEWMKMIVFVSYCMFHAFCNCFFGQSLCDQQIKLFEDLRTIPWYDYDVKVRKTYNIMQLGCKNQIMLSAWKVFYLQYRTFLDFTKSIISYFMVLRQFVHEK